MAIVKVSVFLTTLLLLIRSVSSAACTDDDLRIQSNGTLQICTDKQWKAVCYNDWGNLDTAVACRQLGYDGGYMYETEYYPNAYADATIVDRKQYHCNGTEKKLSDCVMRNISSCAHGVNVTCVYKNISDLCNSGEIRLWGGNTTYEGNLEMCTDHRVWSAITSYNSWNNPDAVVACRQLGYPNSIALPFVRSTFGRRYQPIEFGLFLCSGREQSLKDCIISTRFASTYSDYSYSNIYHYAGVRCLPKGHEICSNGDVRLAGGFLPSNGLAEICIKRHWARICQSYQPTVESRICAKLNYSRSIRIESSVFRLYNGQPMVNVYLADYRCSSASTGLLDCLQNDTNYGVQYVQSCSPYGIICCPNNSCILQTTSSVLEGREFSLHFDSMATSLVATDSVDIRGLEKDIKIKVVKCISKKYTDFTSSALEDGKFYFDDDMLYKGKFSSFGDVSADNLILQLMQCIKKEPWIEYYNTDLRLHVTFEY